MKRFAIIVITAAIFLPFVFTPNLAASVEDFEVESFTADYYLSQDENKSDRLKVVEEIVAVFPDFDQNHGILRAIPANYRGLSVHLDIESVEDDTGLKHKYSTYKDSGNTVIKIGDPNSYVRGRETYKINYSLRNVITFENADEFYWDVNGDQWQQHFGTVAARIHIPAEIAKNLIPDQRCFNGAYGRNEGSCTITRQNTGTETVITAAAQDLNANETLSFVIGFNKGTFTPNQNDIKADRRRPYLIAGSLLILPAATTIFLVNKWRKYGRDPKGRGVIVPQYVPLKELNPLESNIILTEKLENKAISAMVVELAIRKYLIIHELKKKGLFGKTDYELELIKAPNDLKKCEADVIDMFFSTVTPGAKVKLSTLKNKLYSDAQSLAKSVPAQLHEDGYFKRDPHKIRNKYLTWGAISLFSGVFFIFVGVLAGLVGIVIVGNLVISGLILLVCAGIMPGRSDKGVEARDYLLGLRDYMQLAEKDRIKFLQSPEGVKQYGDPTKPKNQIKLFERLLPYAMLLGIEKDWAKQFENLYTSPPDWYSGHHGAFNAAYLASSMNSFSTASMANFSSPKSSSSSGFSGGGFSGGGGGGGGGGGW